MTSDKKQYYSYLMNALYGLRDDLDANDAPEEAKSLLIELIEVCRSDFNIKFNSVDD
jgi:hypothetical protein